ncbi:2044_t:CDS:10 [Acaulospora morrowiae]|uniref:2044_t:CDS:1 n=1 Tax=Acaulospora morrowiae TaxID=94023 RepID=A0A9N9CH25_9GLOM|nr:2044_t:CDS:10 [Acaulospora morrowiae]
MAQISNPWEIDPVKFSSEVTELCHQKYKTIGKGGKPLTIQNRLEWTVIAAIVACHVKDAGGYYLECVSLGSGLKCLPQSRLSRSGDLVHDSHAEVLSRRGFIKLRSYETIDYIRKLLSESTYFYMKDGSSFVSRNSHITFHLYVSQAPCGDASTKSLALHQSPEEAELYASSYSDLRDSSHEINREKEKLNENEIMVLKGKDGFRRGRIDYDSYGVLRTKPDPQPIFMNGVIIGRVDSEPTLSMSCSDKIALWNVVGLQSALLSELILPIYLSTIIVGDYFSREDLKRAFYGRIQNLSNLPDGYATHEPTIIPSTRKFERSNSFLSELFPGENLIPSSTAAVWIKGLSSAEILVSGRKQGAIRSKKTGLYSHKTMQVTSFMTKLNLFQSIGSLLNLFPDNNVPPRLRLFMESRNKSLSYNQLKLTSENYQNAKKALRSQTFNQWIKCPSNIYESFNIDGELIDDRVDDEG